MVLNKNSQGQLFIVKQLPNGERVKARFEKGTSKEWAKKEFELMYNNALKRFYQSL